MSRRTGKGVEGAADRRGVGVGLVCEHGPDGVGAGDHDRDGLDQRLGPGAEEPLRESSAGLAAPVVAGEDGPEPSDVRGVGGRPAGGDRAGGDAEPYGVGPRQSSSAVLTPGRGTRARPSPQKRPSGG